jgi:hypothetical protein
MLKFIKFREYLYISCMGIYLFTKSLNENLITQEEFSHVAIQDPQPVSVHYELRTLLYLGLV